MLKLIVKRFNTKFNQNILYDPKKDYYKILNLGEKADSTEIKKSFYALSIKHHPDKGGKEEDFKLISIAYDVLKSTDDKRYYDKMREDFYCDLNSKLKQNEQQQKYDDINFNSTKTNTKERSYTNNSKHKYKKNHDKAKTKENYNSNKYDDDTSQHSSSYHQQEDSNHYKQNFRGEDNFDTEFNRRYKEFLMNEIKSKEKNVNNFDKFKYNIKYTPPEREVKFPEFDLKLIHKHHMLNRIKNYNQRRVSFSILSHKQRKNLNPFEIYNEMHLDIDYITVLNKSIRDEEKFEVRITVKDIFSCYKKSTLITFLIINFGIVFYLIY